MTTVAYTRKENVVLLKMAPGSGKTYVIIKLIQFHRKNRDSRKFKIITCSQDLKYQFQTECSKFDFSSDVEVYLPNEVTLSCKKSVVFIDEADETIMQGAICYSFTGELVGLCKILEAT